MNTSWRWLFGSCGCLLIAAFSWADTPKDSPEPPKAEVVRFPAAFGTPKAIVGTSSESQLSVVKGVYYIIEAESDCLTLCSPDEAVTITNLRIKHPTGPVIIGGRFAQDPTVEQENEFNAPFIYKVEPGPRPVATAEIIFVTKGDKPTVTRRTVSLTAPRPPPKPDVIPDVSNPLPSSKLRVLMTYDAAETLTAKENSVLRSTKIHAAVDAAKGEWRTWSAKEDASQEDQWWRDAMNRAKGKKQPWVIISSPAGFYEGFPSSVDDFTSQIKKLGG
jgi:hypothetical protein